MIYLTLWLMSGVVAAAWFARTEGVLYLKQTLIILILGPLGLVLAAVMWMDEKWDLDSWDPVIWRRK